MPVIAMLVLSSAAGAGMGDICLPWWALGSVIGSLTAAIAYQTRRIATLTDRVDKRLDVIIEEYRADLRALEERRTR